MIQHSNNRGPWWFGGVLAALALIIISSRGRFGMGNTALQQRFKPQPTAVGAPTQESAPAFNWSLLPAEAQQAMRDVQARIKQGQSAPVLTPVAQSARLRVEVTEVQSKPEGMQVIGKVTNISNEALDVPVSAFQLHDSANAVYSAASSTASHLVPGASTPLDLTVPLPEGRGLRLIVQFPPDPPIEQVLLVAPG